MHPKFAISAYFDTADELHAFAKLVTEAGGRVGKSTKVLNKAEDATDDDDDAPEERPAKKVVKAAAPKKAAPKKAAKEEEPADDDEETPSHEDLIKRAGDLARGNDENMAAIKAFVKKRGAKIVRDLDEKHLPALFDFLNGLEGADDDSEEV